MKYFRTDKIWFKRKRFGWGWYPASWEGWLVTVVYIALVVGFTMTIPENATFKELAVRLFLPLALLTIAFIRVVCKTSETPC